MGGRKHASALRKDGVRLGRSRTVWGREQSSTNRLRKKKKGHRDRSVATRLNRTPKRLRNAGRENSSRSLGGEKDVKSAAEGEGKRSLLFDPCRLCFSGEVRKMLQKIGKIENRVQLDDLQVDLTKKEGRGAVGSPNRRIPIP